MSAKPETKTNPKKRAEEFITTRRSKYFEAIEVAKIAAETTATPGWQNNYDRQMSGHTRAVKQSIGRITDACDAIQASDTTEDDEKAITKAVKSLVDERAQHAAWMKRTVHPYRATAEKCRGILEGTLRSARQSELDAPLVDRGLEAEVKELTEVWPLAKWDDKSGTVTVGE